MLAPVHYQLPDMTAQDKAAPLETAVNFVHATVSDPENNVIHHEVLKSSEGSFPQSLPASVWSWWSISGRHSSGFSGVATVYHFFQKEYKRNHYKTFKDCEQGNFSTFDS